MLSAVMDALPDGRRVRVARLGHGPPLVLLHGYPDNLQIYSELAPRLAERFDVHRVRLAGHGLTAMPGRAQSRPRTWPSACWRCSTHWRVERAHVVGMDMGGQPALALAALHPDRVRRLVVMNSLVLPDEKTSWEIALLRRHGLNRWLLRRLAAAWCSGARCAPRCRAASAFPPRCATTCGAASAGRRCARSWPACAPRYQGTLPRLPALYATIAVPTLVLWGERDRHFPLAHGRRLHEGVPGSALRVIGSGEHWMAWHAAEKVAEEIAAFLQE